MKIWTRVDCLFLQVSLAMSTGCIHAQDAKRFEAGGTSGFSVKGQLELEFSNEYNFDLIGNVEKVYTLEPILELGVGYDNDNDFVMMINLEYGRELEGGNQGRKSEYSSSFTVDEAFVELSDLTEKGSFFDDVSVTMGRKKLSDAREWFYDASVDGLFLEAQSSSLDTDLTFSVNREEWIGSDLLRHNEPDTVSNLVFSLVHHPFKKVDIGAYAIIRDDSSSDNESPRFIALSARGQLLDKRLAFWSDVAVVDGQDGDKSIDGNGYDVGATLKLFESGGLYITLGYAFGSGDGDEDTDFRQTGLQGNSDRFGGVTSFKYYGELTDPELSNLKILTAGIGFRPRSKVSVDLIYHRYEQDVALDELRDSQIDIDPNGRDTDIGSELDLVAGFTSQRNLKAELVLGYFQPGAAFDDAGKSLSFSARLSYGF